MTPFASRLDAGLVALLAAGLVLAAVLAAPVVIQDGDLYWQIAAGRWMLENQAVLRIDPFSASLAGHPWQVQDWLADAALALAYVGAGWSAVLAATASAAALAAALLTHFLARRLSGMVHLAVSALSFLVAAPALTASPTVLALPLFVIWCAELARARADRRGPSLALLPAMILWANTDTSYLAGLAAGALMGLEAVMESSHHRLTVARDWMLFAGLALIAGLITPYGIAGFGAAIAQVQLPQSGTVRTALPLLLAIPAAALLVQARVFALRLVFLAALFLLSLFVKADQLLFAAALPLLLADRVAAVLQHNGLTSRVSLQPILAFVMLGILAIGARLLVVIDRGDEAISPQTALAHVPAPLLHSAVLNDVEFGGFLIFRDLHPFIDGRSFYGNAFRSRYARMMRGDAMLLAATLERRHIRWTLLAPGDPAVAAMDRLGGWRRLYTDRWAVVHVRKDAL